MMFGKFNWLLTCPFLFLLGINLKLDARRISGGRFPLQLHYVWIINSVGGRGI